MHQPQHVVFDVGFELDIVHRTLVIVEPATEQPVDHTARGLRIVISADLAQVAQDEGLNPRDFKLKTMFFSGEPGASIPGVRDRIASYLRALILALPAWRTAQFLRGLEPHAAHVFAAIRYLPSLTVSLAYRSDQVGAVLEGTGFVGQAPLRACTYASRKFPGRAPAGYELIRAFLSEPPGPPEQAAHQSLLPILRLTGEPLWSRTYAWPRGIPFYAPDHAVRLADARRRLAGIGNLWLAGAGYDGAGVGACIRSGREAGRGALQMANVQ